MAAITALLLGSSDVNAAPAGPPLTPPPKKRVPAPTPPPKSRTLLLDVPVRLACPAGAHQLRFKRPQGPVTYCALDGTTRRHGPYRSWFKNGKLREYGQYERGVKVGQWRQWHKNGKRQSVYTVKQGQLHGMFVQWYPNGKQSQVGIYRYGRRVQCWRTWYPSGEVRETHCYSSPLTNEASEPRRDRSHRTGKTLRDVGMALTLASLLMSPLIVAGVPMWVAGSVRYNISDTSRTFAARKALRKRYLVAGIALTVSGLALTGIGVGLFRAAIDEHCGTAKGACATTGIVAMPVGLFAAVLVGMPMWIAAAQWTPPPDHTATHLDPDTRKLARWTGQQALDPGHERGLMQRLHAGQPRPTMFTAQLNF